MGSAPVCGAAGRRFRFFPPPRKNGEAEEARFSVKRLPGTEETLFRRKKCFKLFVREFSPVTFDRRFRCGDLFRIEAALQLHQAQFRFVPPGLQFLDLIQGSDSGFELHFSVA